MKLIYILLIGTLLLCSSGIVAAANITLFTDENMETAQNTITDSNIGDVIALLDLVSKLLLVIVPILLLITIIVARATNNAEQYKGAIKGLVYIGGAVLIIQVYFSLIGGMTPDISIVEF